MNTKPKVQTERVLVTLTKKEKQELQKIATKQNRSLSSLVGWLVKDFLQKCKEQ